MTLINTLTLNRANINTVSNAFKVLVSKLTNGIESKEYTLGKMIETLQKFDIVWFKNHDVKHFRCEDNDETDARIAAYAKEAIETLLLSLKIRISERS